MILTNILVLIMGQTMLTTGNKKSLIGMKRLFSIAKFQISVSK